MEEDEDDELEEELEDELSISGMSSLASRSGRASSSTGRCWSITISLPSVCPSSAFGASSDLDWIFSFTLSFKFEMTSAK